PALWDYGMSMSNLGDIDRQTLAGAISTGTHGTGIDSGILSTQISKMELMTPEKGWVQCSEENNPELFRAAQVSLGALGIIASITLDLEPAYYLHERVRKQSLGYCLNNLDDLRQNNRHFEFFWFPGTEIALTKTLNKTDQPDSDSSWQIGERIENLLFEVLCGTGTVAPVLSPLLNKLTVFGASTSDCNGRSYEIFSTVRSVRFNEMEYSIPIESTSEVLRRIRNLIERNHPEVQFPVEVRFVSGDDIPLSPAYGDNRAFIALHKYHRKPYEEFFRSAESIFRDFGGRPHWGKMHYQSAPDLRGIYPQWDDFQRVRKRLDPKGVMLNDYLEGLFDEK
ncbi:MAG: D-arabinono-1,4-lactone oxidase, partial [bacterium]